MKKVRRTIKGYTYARNGKTVRVKRHMRSYMTNPTRKNFGISLRDFGDPRTGSALRKAGSARRAQESEFEDQLSDIRKQAKQQSRLLSEELEKEDVLADARIMAGRRAASTAAREESGMTRADIRKSDAELKREKQKVAVEKFNAEVKQMLEATKGHLGKIKLPSFSGLSKKKTEKLLLDMDVDKNKPSWKTNQIKEGEDFQKSLKGLIDLETLEKRAERTQARKKFFEGIPLFKKTRKEKREKREFEREKKITKDLGRKFQPGFRKEPLSIIPRRPEILSGIGGSESSTPIILRSAPKDIGEIKEWERLAGKGPKFPLVHPKLVTTKQKEQVEKDAETMENIAKQIKKTEDLPLVRRRV